MADSFIGDLPDASPFTTGDLVPIERATADGRVTISAAVAALLAGADAAAMRATLLVDNPYCAISNSTTQSIADSTTTAITFDTEAEDTTGMHSTVSNTSRINANVAGLYSVTGAVFFAASAVGIRDVFFRMNGTTIVPAEMLFSGTGSGTGVSCATTIRLAVSDYVELCVWQNSGGALNSINQNGQPIFRVAKFGN